MDAEVSETVNSEMTTIATAKSLQGFVAGVGPPPPTLPSPSVPTMNKTLPTQSGIQLPPVDVSSRTPNGLKVPSAAASSSSALIGEASNSTAALIGKASNSSALIGGASNSIINSWNKLVNLPKNGAIKMAKTGNQASKNSMFTACNEKVKY